MSMGFSHLIFVKRLRAISCINFHAVFTKEQLAKQASDLCVDLPLRLQFYLSKSICKTQKSIVFRLSPASSVFFSIYFLKYLRFLAEIWPRRSLGPQLLLPVIRFPFRFQLTEISEYFPHSVPYLNCPIFVSFYRRRKVDVQMKFEYPINSSENQIEWLFFFNSGSDHRPAFPDWLVFQAKSKKATWWL
jgi:hypothetical protein